MEDIAVIERWPEYSQLIWRFFFVIKANIPFNLEWPAHTLPFIMIEDIADEREIVFPSGCGCWEVREIRMTRHPIRCNEIGICVPKIAGNTAQSRAIKRIRVADEVKDDTNHVTNQRIKDT